MSGNSGNLHQLVVAPLKKVVNDRGYLQEVQRSDEPHFPGFGQAYLTATNPGVIKAWYRHHRQIDQIALAQGTLRLALYDARPASPTFGVVQELVISDDRPVLVQIPTGIWHGFQALGTGPALLLHLNTVAFRFGDVDEDRLPPATPEIPYRWSD